MLLNWLLWWAGGATSTAPAPTLTPLRVDDASRPRLTVTDHSRPRLTAVAAPTFPS